MLVSFVDYGFIIFIIAILLSIGGVVYWFRKYLKRSYSIINILIGLIVFHYVFIMVFPNTQSEMSVVDGIWMLSVVVFIGWSIIAVIQDVYLYLKNRFKEN